MTFQKYVLDKANTAHKNLKSLQDVEKSFRTLTECVLALTLLLNRKRIGEIQFLTVNVYCAHKDKGTQNDFSDCLTESEKMLTNFFMRVVTGGKGSKPVPVLFPSTSRPL